MALLSTAPHKFARPPWQYYRLQKIRKYDFGVDINGMTPIHNFIQIRQAVPEFNLTDGQTEKHGQVYRVHFISIIQRMHSKRSWAASKGKRWPLGRVLTALYSGNHTGSDWGGFSRHGLSNEKWLLRWGPMAPCGELWWTFCVRKLLVHRGMELLDERPPASHSTLRSMVLVSYISLIQKLQHEQNYV